MVATFNSVSFQTQDMLLKGMYCRAIHTFVNHLFLFYHDASQICQSRWNVLDLCGLSQLMEQDFVLESDHRRDESADEAWPLILRQAAKLITISLGEGLWRAWLSLECSAKEIPLRLRGCPSWKELRRLNVVGDLGA